jgi:hypothetical protein
MAAWPKARRAAAPSSRASVPAARQRGRHAAALPQLRQPVLYGIHQRQQQHQMIHIAITVSRPSRPLSG